MDREKSNKFDELSRVVDLTAKARYRASTRLGIHGMWSQWTLSLLAIGLIIVSVVSISGIKTNFSEVYTDVMQIIFSVVILTYSLLLGMGDFSSRSAKLHKCGMELSRIIRKIKPFKGKDDEEHDGIYKEYSKEYYDCLEKYENHKNVDFLESRLEIERRKGYPDKSSDEKARSFLFRFIRALETRAALWVSIKLRTTFAFFH